MICRFSEVLLKYVEDEYYLERNTNERDAFELAQEKELSKKLEQIEKNSHIKGGMGRCRSTAKFLRRKIM